MLPCRTIVEKFHTTGLVLGNNKTSWHNKSIKVMAYKTSHTKPYASV